MRLTKSTVAGQITPAMQAAYIRRCAAILDSEGTLPKSRPPKQADDRIDGETSVRSASVFTDKAKRTDYR